MHVIVGPNTFYLNEPPKLRTLHKEEWRHENVVVPFWWVATTAVETEANMIEKTMKDVKLECTFTCLVNSCHLSPGDKLFVYRKKADKTPLSSASSQCTAPPAKKAQPPSKKAAPTKAAPTKAAPPSKRKRSA